MAYILNIESSTNICSVCISKDGQMLSIRETSTNNHASQMTLFIEQCLTESNIKITGLSAVAISNGPGSYTSLRVGISTAKGICYGLGIPLIAVDTLTVMSMAAYEQVNDDSAIYCPMIDARRMEVYHSLFEIEGGQVKIIESMTPLIVDEESFKRYYEAGKRLIFSGNGSMKCATVLPHDRSIFVDENGSSKNMIKLSTTKFEIKEFVDIAYHTPEYLKAPNITTPKNVVNT